MNTFKNFTLEIHISSECNINCSNCNSFSPCSEKYFLTIDMIKEQIFYIKKLFPEIKEIFLSGGEPLLNNNLYEIVKIIHNEMPYLNIGILSNGILMKEWTNEDFQKYEKLKTIFYITQYPDYDYSYFLNLNPSNLQIIKKNILLENLVDIRGSQETKKNFQQCSRKINLQLKDYFLYICPFSAYIKNFSDKFNLSIDSFKSDYLDIRYTNLEEFNLFYNKIKKSCSFCNQEQSKEFAYNKTFSDIFLDYTQTKRSSYLTNYTKYNLKYNNSILKNTSSIIDIIIPYQKINNKSLDELYNNLIEQKDILKCTIYLISDNSPNEAIVYDKFNSSLLNCYFLKNQTQKGIEEAKRLGINNSSSPFVLFLDFNDRFYLNTSIQTLINFVYKYNNKNIDYFSGYEKNNIEDKQKERILLINREFLQKNKLNNFNNFFSEFYVLIANTIYFKNIL